MRPDKQTAALRRTPMEKNEAVFILSASIRFDPWPNCLLSPLNPATPTNQSSRGQE
jgi:hypothetical protein